MRVPECWLRILLLALLEKTKETESQLGSPHPGKFLDGLRNQVCHNSGDERAGVVIGSSAWVLAQPVPRCHSSLRQHSNVKIQMVPLAGQGWSHGGRRLWEGKTK